jgi:hypothetical protein
MIREATMANLEFTNERLPEGNLAGSGDGYRAVAAVHNPTVVEVVSYYTCHDCERHVQLPEAAGVTTCACGTEVEPIETEEVDG